jgi:SH3-like domain-containing protein
VARLEPGVLGELDDCEGAWCRIEVSEERGWLPREALWGALPGE